MNHIIAFENYNENFRMATPTSEPGNTFEEGKEIYVGQKVKVFRNLNTSAVMNKFDKNDIIHAGRNEDVIWSIRDFKSDKTVHYSYDLWMREISFLVNQGVRNKVLRTGQKDIHSFIVGRLITWKPFNFDVDTKNIKIKKDQFDNVTIEGWSTVYYNPYQVDCYVIPNIPMYRELGLAGYEVFSADECIMAQQNIGGKMIPACYVLNAVLGNQSVTDWSHKGATPLKAKSAGAYSGKHKNKLSTQDKINKVKRYYDNDSVEETPDRYDPSEYIQPDDYDPYNDPRNY